MKVTAITRQVKNPERVSISVDGKYCFSLSIDQLLYEQLKKGDEVSDDRVKQLKELSTNEKLRLKVMAWALLRPRSELELRQYIRRLRMKDRTIGDLQWVIDSMVNRRFVDDRAFAEWWVGRTSRQSKSVSELRSELMSKGINRSLIQSVLHDRNDDTLLTELIYKLASRPKYQDRTRLVRYLQTKGFSYSSIVAALGLVAGDS